MNKTQKTCSFEISETGGETHLIKLCGRLDIETAMGTYHKLSAELKNRAIGFLDVDISGISYLDDYGVLVLYELKHALDLNTEHFRLVHVPQRFSKTLSLVNFDFEKRCPLSSRRIGENFIVQLGETTINSLLGIKFFVSFIGSVFLALAQILKKPKSLRFDDMIWHMKTTGIDALPVVALIGFLLGLIMAFVSSLQLKQFGANIYVASLVALAMVSELGPIMTAILVAGRSGSAYAAEISTMQISEEIDALFSMGFDPTIFLVIPRLIAAFIVIPILTIFANIFAIAGGMVIGITMLGLTVASYIDQTMETLNLFEFFWGLSKSLVFAVLIAGVGCLKGFQARGGASAVGNAATSAVVTSIFLIILVDSMFAVIRSYWG